MVTFMGANGEMSKRERRRFATLSIKEGRVHHADQAERKTRVSTRQKGGEINPFFDVKWKRGSGSAGRGK